MSSAARAQTPRRSTLDPLSLLVCLVVGELVKVVIEYLFPDLAPYLSYLDVVFDLAAIALFAYIISMPAVRAVIVLTWKAGLRFRLFLVIAVLLLAGVIGLPILIKDDGTARGFTQIVLTYTLAAMSALLGFSTLWLSCGTLARDIEECQIQVVATKPIARWQIWLGKWLGILSLNAALLAISGACVYGLLQWRATKLPANEQEVLHNEVLIARGSMKPPSVDDDIKADAAEVLKQRLKQMPVSDADLPEVEKNITEQVRAAYQVVQPGYRKIWRIPFGLRAKSLRDQPLQLRVKFETANKSTSGNYVGVWHVGAPPQTRVWEETEPSLAPETFHEFTIDPGLIDDKGVLTIYFDNFNDTALLFPLDDGMEVLYRQGSFGLNFIRGLGVIFCWMALLAAIGLAAASFLSFPVAAFLSLAILTTALSSGTLAGVVADNTIDNNSGASAKLTISAMNTLIVPAFSVALKVINLAEDFSPISSLSTGGASVGGNSVWPLLRWCCCLEEFLRYSEFLFSTGANWRPRRTSEVQVPGMSGRLKKILILVLVAALLTGTAFLQNSLNHDRDTLGLTHVEGLTNAPPVLAFTTVALGGFRGLISNILWTRENQLQEDDKFFEMAQLSDWITKLEPHFSQVWTHEAWNMAYNISVKFKDYSDRWRWVQNGIELLRDQGLRYNPDDVLIHQQLAWFFQHKMGANLDDASMYYKSEWKKDMEEVFGGKKPDFDALIHPRTADETNRARLLRDTYKMDPVLMKEIDAEYGPLEWRLPETHAIYWASEGLVRATNNPSKVKQDDLIMLRRVLYQSMQQGWVRGRLVDNPFNTNVTEMAPNLEIIPKVNDAYLKNYAEETQPNQKDGILKAHRNFLRQAVYALYEYDRVAEAARWFKYLGEKYPDKTIIDGDPNSYPRNLTLDQYAVACVQEDINETSPDRVRGILEGLLRTSYINLVLDQDDRAAGLQNLAKKAWNSYQTKITTQRTNALYVASISEIARDVRAQLLNPTNGLPPQAQAVLRTKLGMPAEQAAPIVGSSTNAP